MSAVRLARGFTGKSRVVKFEGNYHGHADQFLTGAGSGVSHLPACPGIPEEMVRSTLSLRYNDIAGVRKILQTTPDIACVILEPMAANIGLVPADAAFLQMLREETKKIGALLIFDEVVTGFRVGLQGAQGFYKIQPDLTCLAKIIGGGFPAAAFGGKKEIMEHLAPLGNVYQAGTLSGNPVAMSAGFQALQELKKPGFYQELKEKTERLCCPIQQLIHKKKIPATLTQVGSMFSLFFGVTKITCKEDLATLNKECFRQLFTFLFERGVYFSPSPYETCFISAAHTHEQIDYTRELVCEFIEQL
jgi:glutamate-1-semialdehyde 2,1-aminomutase